MAAKFLNQQLISSRRFAPGSQNEPPTPKSEPGRRTAANRNPAPSDASHDVEPDESPAAASTSEALPDSASASSDQPGQLDSQAEAAGQAKAGLQTILAREAGATRETSTRREIRELQKRRLELIQRLQELRAEIEQEREALEAKSHFFRAQQEELRKFPDEIEARALRSLRQALNNAHIETLKFERQGQGTAGTSAEKGRAGESLASLSFLQLTRIGAALLWPLLLTLLLVGLGIAASLYLLFNI